MLHDVQLEALVTERQVFKIFAANVIDGRSCGYARIVFACNIRGRLVG